MSKKLLTLTLTVVMMLVMFGLTACNNDTLDAYKTAGKAAIETYAKKRKDNYCEDDWTVVCGIVEAGKTIVDEAKSKPTVDTAVATAKAEIDAVGYVGAFYSLQKAFDNGWLTKEDLQSIAYYLNDDSMPIYPDALSAEIEKAIKETRASNLRAEVDADGVSRFPDTKTEDVLLRGYYGKYNNLFAVMIADSFTEYGQAEWSEIIDGVTFHYADGNRILIWKKEKKGTEQVVGTFCNLQEAYDAGFITRDDLMHIAFFVAGEVLDADLARIDFATQVETPALIALEASIIDGMKMAFYEKHKTAFDSHGANANDATVVGFFGEYSGSFAVQMTATFMEYGEGLFIENIADIAWSQFAPSITIFVIS